MKNKALLMAALMALTAVPSVAEAKKPKKKQAVDVNNYNQRIRRSKLSFDIGHTTLTLNGRKYEKGPYLGVNGSLDFDLIKWLNLRSTFDFGYQSMALLTENATENSTDLNLSLEARTKLYFSDDLRLYLGLGADHIYMRNDLLFGNTKGNEQWHTAGPMVGFSLESRYVDVYLLGSVVFGKKNSSYDKPNDILMQHGKLTIVPRYWRVELPIITEFKHWAITEKVIDRDNFDISIKVQPTFKVTPYFSLHLNVGYSERQGEDFYNELNLGGGLTLWLK